MNRAAVLVLPLLFAATPAVAQTTDGDFQQALSPSTAAVLKAMFATIRQNLADAADLMAPQEYAFKPTPEVRSFGQLIGHLANANFFFCGLAKGERPPSTTDNEKLTDKAALVQTLRASLAYCDGVYDSTTDTTAARMVKLPGRTGNTETAASSVLVFNTTHDNEHYGNLVVYLRLRGHVPPSTARVQGK